LAYAGIRVFTKPENPGTPAFHGCKEKVIGAFAGLHYNPAHEKITTRVKRTLKPGGILHPQGEHMDRWEPINAVQRMQSYIEAHLQEPITLHRLAEAAGYSPWHAAKVFKALTGKSPFEYIRAVRLSRAAVRLRDEEVKIVDVAFDFVFDSHEGFTRAFSKQFGVTPHQFSQTRPAIKLFMPRNVREIFLTSQKGEQTMSEPLKTSTIFVQVVERPARKLILKRGVKAADYYAYCEEVGCEVWDILTKVQQALYEPIGMWLPENLQKPGTSRYAQGVEIPLDYAGPIPEGFDLVDLPACQMMIFQGPPYDDAAFEEAIGSLWETIKNYRPELYGFRWADEDGPRFQLEPQGYRGYIEGRPVRPVG
jgi:AraC family transcriptional regulator